MSAHAPTLSRLHSQDGSSHEDKRSLEETPDTTRAPSRPEPVRRMGEIDVSMGVARIEAINSCLTTPLRAWLMFSAFLVAYAYGLDATVRGTLQSYATSSFQNHSLLATVNVLKSIVAAASYPAYSKIADTFGRPEVVLFSVVMYVIGTIVEATSTNIQSFCAGAVLYQFGYSAAILIVEVIISDLTSLRSRLFFSYIPALPFIINCWAGANVVAQIQATTTWQVGIGIWAAVYPFCCLCLLGPLYIAQRRARRAGKLDGYLTPFQQLGFKRLMVTVFWELDLVGSILIIAVLALILLPFTLAGGVDKEWAAEHNIAMLVIGVVVCIPLLIVWETKYAKVPALPFHLLKTRTVLGCLGIATFLDVCWYMQGDYLYTVLVVAFHESVLSATRITSMYSFASVITGTLAGLFVRFCLPRLKPIILAGVSLWFIAFGLLIHYRGGASAHSGIVGAQVLLGISGGLFPYPAQTLIQTAGNHQHTAILLSIYLAIYNVGSAIGATISGAIWTQVLPGKLEIALGGNTTAVQEWYGSPFTAITTAAGQWGQPDRMAVVDAYRHVQRLLCITGIAFAVPLLLCALVVRDPVLGKEQSLPDAEKDVKARVDRI
ncbi:hypothetical protein NBRC10512_005931 [Rhodotorula toruloides]|uniref:RHTO0S02e01376g1_1 n=2 Tax=Rhodotorula toruloides TaxID=5286 RepID=A0A061AGX9_RHOTO|nr:MFS transporter, siderophore-iron:H+ symporter [Rhodotorula toruloides NP11]EMS22092.1 MFS transporter, siderophore-iron:H+ symporter [Rhodotorula toruloides NP11]CDR36381.1 RHTO0S02e01376g1_1 [Rhodotorula toruloides]